MSATMFLIPLPSPVPGTDVVRQQVPDMLADCGCPVTVLARTDTLPLITGEHAWVAHATTCPADTPQNAARDTLALYAALDSQQIREADTDRQINKGLVYARGLLGGDLTGLTETGRRAVDDARRGLRNKVDDTQAAFDYHRRTVRGPR
jgi:hypothetical protein